MQSFPQDSSTHFLQKITVRNCGGAWGSSRDETAAEGPYRAYTSQGTLFSLKHNGRFLHGFLSYHKTYILFIPSFITRITGQFNNNVT